MCDKAISIKHYTCSPLDIRSQNMFNFSVSFHQENAKRSNIILFSDYLNKHCLEGYIHITSQFKGFVLLHLFYISVVGPKVPSSLKTTKHETFNFWYNINKIHTRRSASMLQLLRYFHSLAYSCVWHLSLSVMANRQSWAVWKTSLACSTFRSHLN